MKSLILTFALAISTLTLCAQNYSTTIGVKVLPGMSTVYGRGKVALEGSKFSISEGIEIRQRMHKDLIYLQTGVYLFNKGVQFSINATDENGSYIGKIKGKEVQNYLTVPLSLVFKFGGLYIGSGLNVNYYLNRKFYNDGELISTETSFYQKDIIYGIQAFGGYEFILNSRLAMGVEMFALPTFKTKFLNYGIGLSLKYIYAKRSN